MIEEKNNGLLKNNKKLILASSSLQRIELLTQIGISPDHIHSPAVEEKAKFFESPWNLSLRLACAKAKVAQANLQEMEHLQGAIVLAADTIVAVKRKILFKPTTKKEALNCLRILSGRTHNVYTSICVIAQNKKIYSKLVETKVTFMPLSEEYIENYLDTNEWYSRAGGYAIQGQAGKFVSFISGSYTGVVGLPLYETAKLLEKQFFFLIIKIYDILLFQLSIFIYFIRTKV
ncbi:nucleoside triphosphate pyrophosphatase [Bartonella sp. DGB1]|uniref:Maf family protein n=1 Tax=Bartonella sp. DGB1 TaxID=3239807 RepID=UPI003524EC6B